MQKGRPKKEEAEKRDVEVKIRLTKTENERIQKLADTLRMTKARLMRSIILGDLDDVELLTNIGLIPIIQKTMAFYDKNFKGKDYYEGLDKDD